MVFALLQQDDPVTIERWSRRHANGWTAVALRDEEGRWWASAQAAGQGASMHSTTTSAGARTFADDQIPPHTCSRSGCEEWHLES